MPINYYKIVGGRWNRKVCNSGESAEYMKYEKAIISGKLPCPFKVEFKNKAGEVIRTTPLPLTPAGKPKINLFG